MGLVKVRGKSHTNQQFIAPFSGQHVDAWSMDFSYPLFAVWIPSIYRIYYHDWFVVSNEDGKRVKLAPESVALTAKASFSKYVWPWSWGLKKRCRELLMPGERLPFIFFHVEENVVKGGEELEVVAEAVPYTQSDRGGECGVLKDGPSTPCHIRSLENPPSQLLFYFAIIIAFLFVGLGTFLLAGVVLKIQTLMGVILLAGAIIFSLSLLTYALLSSNK
jgi:hypothetical protein